MFEIYLRRKNKVILTPGSNNSTSTYVIPFIATIIKNIEQYGYTFSKDIINILSSYEKIGLEVFYLELVKILQKRIGAHVQYRPMYPNFPKQVMDTPIAELFINAIIHYWTFGQLLPEYEKEIRFPLPDITKLKVIELGTEKDFLSIFENLVLSKTSLSKSDKDDIKWFLTKYSTPSLKVLKGIDAIPHKENVALIGKFVIEKFGLRSTFILQKYCKTATDVLRLAVALSEGDISLAKIGKFKSFSRKQRTVLLSLLNKCNNIETDMLRYKNAWIRLGERLHPGEAQFRKYTKALEAFDKIRNNKKIYTVRSLIELYLSTGKYDTVLTILSRQPGDFARKLDFLLRTTTSNKEKILNSFEKVINQVSTPVLLQLREHFKVRENTIYPHQGIRSFFPKGNTAKLYVIENKLPLLDKSLCQQVIQLCERALITRYSERENLNKVFIDPVLTGYTIPFSQRSASKTLKSFSRGTRIAIDPNAKTIRSFVYWKEEEGSRADIDLSAIFYDSDWVYKNHISYTNLRDRTCNCVHSGDIVSAPAGACEFIDIDIDSCLKENIHYIIISLFAYTIQPFCNLPECFMGWMERQYPMSGEIFEPKTVIGKSDIASNMRICIPIVLDLPGRQIIWTDLALTRQFNYNNLENNRKSLPLMGKAIVKLKKPNLYDLFSLHARARGQITQNIDEADTIFALDKGITPHDTDIIMSQFL